VRSGAFLGIVLSILIFSGGAHALVVSEKTLSTSGFSGLIVDGFGQSRCDDFEFAPFTGHDEEGNDTILTLNVQTTPTNDNDANVQVFVNDALFQTIRARDLLENNTIHVRLPADIQEEQNTIRVCGNNSAVTERVTIRSDTKMGLYQLARFDEINAFQTFVAGKSPVLGDPITIELYLTNNGGEAAEVSIDYRKYELEYIPLLKGETGFSGIILPGETKKLVYDIKPLRAVSILLPPAVLTYTNIFDEKITQESTRAFLLVDAPEFNVRGAFLVPQVRVNVNETVNVQWVAQNDGITPIEGLRATFNVYPEGKMTPASTIIETLSPAKAVSQPFTVTFDKPGIYTLGCYLSPKADPFLTTNCQSATIEVVEPNTGITLLFSLLILLIAIAVYAYIYVLPDAPPKAEPPKRGRFYSGK
jgi:hypothetical protein